MRLTLLASALFALVAGAAAADPPGFTEPSDSDAPVPQPTHAASPSHAGPAPAAMAMAAPPLRPPSKRPGREGNVRTAKEYFETLGQRFRPSAARGIDAVIQFELSGAEACSYYVTIREATMRLARGVAPRSNVTLAMNATDYIKVVNGEMNGTNAYLGGALKIRGSLGLARKMKRMFPPGAIKP